MLLLDGKLAREYFLPLLKKRVEALPFTPCLVIIQVGDRADSNIYINGKKKFVEKIGGKIIHIKLEENVSQEKVTETIKEFNVDKKVQGIIVQLPLPAHLNPGDIISAIAPEKDTDGMTKNTKATPATAKGVKDLLEFYKIDLKNKKVTVVGQSKLVGMPISKMCEREGAMVTSCDSKTQNLWEKTKAADILIVAIGSPKFINEKYVSRGQVVIDVGITRNPDGTTVDGDVDFENIKDIVGAITPVPGGVGQMTVLALFENLIDACYNTK
jgi:methylenetetrahydrofolate dehydrogenase (NADP+)/methenyltetrahydrofolate cyclohydrolase